MPQRKKRIMIIAGSDPVAGAGIQADLKTVTALGGYAMTAITAVTVQNSLGVSRILSVSPEIVVEQITACLDDVGADVIKLGMLANGEVMRAVIRILKKYPPIPVIADPVMAAGEGGKKLLEQVDAIDLRAFLSSLSLITPNISEAEKLTSSTIYNREDMLISAKKLQSYLSPSGAVLITGGHLAGDIIWDLLYQASGAYHFFKAPRLPDTVGFHGTGCTLASALAMGMAEGMPLKANVDRAIRFVRKSMNEALSLGGGQKLLYYNHKTVD
ncbi:bifunctional hydroxymethylpyrimidine kinase/phosphomethylpyrimidine kinase [Magnetococcales bacterium HHB-1]